MKEVLDNKLSVLMICDHNHLLRSVGQYSQFDLSLSDVAGANDKLSKEVFNVVVFKNVDEDLLKRILVQYESLKQSEVFILSSSVSDKGFIKNIHDKICFLELPFEDLSLDTILHWIYLENIKNQICAENKSLKEKLDFQKVMISELEQTNNNLISATWRERDMKQKLKEAMDEVEKSHHIISVQNKRISESINYSCTIQSAINPTEEDLRHYIPDSFIFYKPKDTVSGDFPWLTKKEDSLYLAVADCTGHGVPGAMMSMIGNLLLSGIVNQYENISTGLVLDYLHQSMVNTLKQKTSKSNSRDGMDIILIQIFSDKREIHFSSAHRPLYLIRNNQVIEYKGDPFPIGGIQYDRKRLPYNTNVISYQEGDIVLIFSDGLPDQTGGENGQKFMSGQVVQIALENTQCSMEQLKINYEQQVQQWMGNAKQIDDMLLIGIKF